MVGTTLFRRGAHRNSGCASFLGGGNIFSACSKRYALRKVLLRRGLASCHTISTDSERVPNLASIQGSATRIRVVLREKDPSRREDHHQPRLLYHGDCASVRPDLLDKYHGKAPCHHGGIFHYSDDSFFLVQQYRECEPRSNSRVCAVTDFGAEGLQIILCSHTFNRYVAIFVVFLGSNPGVGSRPNAK